MAQQGTRHMDYWKAEAALRKTFPIDIPTTIAECLAIRDKMSSYASRCQISSEDVDNLNIIHVTGTKGKGSTCVLTESILRTHGYKTGLFMSPHIIDTNERIRINGANLPMDLFAKYYWEIEEKFLQTKDAHNGEMPYRFALYTIFALYVCVHEKVDVCILEVGVGGETDCTNFIRKPWLCAVTSIDIDHVARLGNTKEKIAWHKAGIFKQGATAFVGNVYNESVLQIIKTRATEKNVLLYGVPDLSTYDTNGNTVEIGISGDIQKSNASLALQLAQTWMKRKENCSYEIESSKEEGYHLPVCEAFPLTDLMLKGLAEARIICRGDIVKKKGITYYFDMAHTATSVNNACDWFFEEVEKEKNITTGKSIKILIFSTMPWRSSHDLLSPLVNKPFDAVLFSTCNAYPGYLRQCWYEPDDCYMEQMRDKCAECRETWYTLTGKTDINDKFNSVQEALVWATQGRDPHLLRKPQYPLVKVDQNPESKIFDLNTVPLHLQGADHIHVFATGNSQLVGCAFCLASHDIY